MPNERVSMSKLKQLIALQTSNLSVRAMGRALGLSVGAVSKYLRAVRAAGISAEEAETLPEPELEQRVFGPTPPEKPPRRVPPDCTWIHTELKRHRHVTLQLLWGSMPSTMGPQRTDAARSVSITGAGSADSNARCASSTLPTSSSSSITQGAPCRAHVNLKIWTVFCGHIGGVARFRQPTRAVTKRESLQRRLRVRIVSHGLEL